MKSLTLKVKIGERLIYKYIMSFFFQCQLVPFLSNIMIVHGNLAHYNKTQKS